MVTDEQLIQRIRTELRAGLGTLNPPVDLLQRLDDRAAAEQIRPASLPRVRMNALVVAISTACTIAVVAIALVSLGDRRAAQRPPALTQPHGVIGIPQPAAGSTPTLSQLLNNFAVLRRPPTATDRGLEAYYRAGQISRYDRYVTTLATGYRIYLYVDRSGQPAPNRSSAALSVIVVDPHRRSTSSVSFQQGVGYTVFPLSSGGSDAVWTSIVPDGVGSVTWHFTCSGGRARCAGVPARTFTIPVVNNVAVRQIANAGCNGCVYPAVTIWHAPSGRTVATFAGSGQLAAAPFVIGSPGRQVLRVLSPAAIGAARIGESTTTATRTLRRLLGPPVATNAPVNACGIDTESVWASPTVADPLEVFTAGARIVGYAYGGTTQGPDIQPGPGAILATVRGLMLSNTVTDARQLYHQQFTANITGNHGNWRARTSAGTLSGRVSPTYPGPKITTTSPIVTITSGRTGCDQHP